MEGLKELFKSIGRKLKQMKEELERESVAVSKTEHIDCCNPPKEIFERKIKRGG
jgi:hypothetical protein